MVVEGGVDEVRNPGCLQLVRRWQVRHGHGGRDAVLPSHGVPPDVLHTQRHPALVVHLLVAVGVVVVAVIVVVVVLVPARPMGVLQGPDPLVGVSAPRFHDLRAARRLQVELDVVLPRYELVKRVDAHRLVLGHRQAFQDGVQSDAVVLHELQGLRGPHEDVVLRGRVGGLAVLAFQEHPKPLAVGPAPLADELGLRQRHQEVLQPLVAEGGGEDAGAVELFVEVLGVHAPVGHPRQDGLHLLNHVRRDLLFDEGHLEPLPVLPAPLDREDVAGERHEEVLEPLEAVVAGMQAELGKLLVQLLGVHLALGRVPQDLFDQADGRRVHVILLEQPHPLHGPLPPQLGHVLLHRALQVHPHEREVTVEIRIHGAEGDGIVRQVDPAVALVPELAQHRLQRHAVLHQVVYLGGVAREEGDGPLSVAVDGDFGRLALAQPHPLLGPLPSQLDDSGARCRP
mmetsp:Transcript_3551/g.9657  ORF Transcript_3551/g.9657 Transcript_3551/m.9657 type:complete len:455 (-) Transcript_3551:241-1605(-)